MSDLKSILDSPRYELTGEVLGKGTWGTVYHGKDTATGEYVALKVLTPTEEAREQMVARKLTPFEALRNEGDLAACRHIVPRVLEIDARGTPFVRMPVYSRFLDSVQTQFTNPDVLKGYLEDIAEGLGEMHTVRKRVHGDLKLDNIALEENGSALINDLGTSTCASFGWSVSPRDNMGHLYTRAPECFATESHPTPQSDVWSFGALAYKMFTGEYPFEEEIKSKDATIFESPKKYRELLKKKLKKLPFSERRLNKVIETCLEFSPSARFYNGTDLSEHYHANVTDPSLISESIQAVKRVGLPAAIGTLAVAAIYGIVSLTSIDSPYIVKPSSKIKGFIYLESDSTRAPRFEVENINNLPYEEVNLGLDTTYIAKSVTDNRSLAFLVNCFHKSSFVRGSIATSGIYDYQRDTMTRVLGKEAVKKIDKEGSGWWKTSLWNIERAMNSVRDDKGNVDLEDMCVVSCLGEGILDEAKRISGSQDYQVYRDAKRADGSRVIQKGSREFIDIWLGQINR